MKKKFINLVTNFNFILALFVLVTLAVSIHNYLLSDISLKEKGYTHYNNYVIFGQSYNHLVQGSNLYQSYPEEYFDLYKYSPTFSLFFGIFNVLPDYIGLPLWNLINTLLLFSGFRYLLNIKPNLKAWMLYFVFLQLITSIQNSQSNGMMAGLLIFALIFLEKKQYIWATFLIVFSAYIKIFGLAALVLLIFYPNKLKLSLYTVGWIIILGLLPALFIGLDSLIIVYQQWGEMLSGDYSSSTGLSMMGWLNTWFGIYPDKFLLVFIGMILLILPLIHIKKYKDLKFRLLYLSSILIWVIIFNHKAESPTFVLAMSGIAIWGFSGNRTNWNTILLIIAFILTSLTATDIFPPSMRSGIIESYVIKALPGIFIWFILTYQLLFLKYDPIHSEKSMSKTND